MLAEEKVDGKFQTVVPTFVVRDVVADRPGAMGAKKKLIQTHKFGCD